MLPDELSAQIRIVEWLMIILLGGVMGMIGQGIRTVVGLKKLQDSISQTGQSFRDSFETNRLTVSLLIGFIAGALAAITLVRGDTVQVELLMGLLAAGYAGTDFIEGFARKYLPAGQTPGGSRATAGPANVAAGEDDLEPPAMG